MMNVPSLEGLLPAKVRQALYLTAVVLIVLSGTADAVYAGMALAPAPIVTGAQKGLLYLAAALLTMGATKVTPDKPAEADLNIVVNSPTGDPGEVVDEIRSVLAQERRWPPAP